MQARWPVVLATAAVLATASGCSWQQAYLAAQGWQRNACYRAIDEIARERCLSGSGMSYEDYRRQADAGKGAL